MRTKIKTALAILLMATLFAGCTGKMSLLFSVETGDKIKLELDTSKGHELNQKDGMFYINDAQENTLMSGFFVTDVSYEAYMNALKMPGVTIHEESIKNGCSYVFYEMVGENHIENNYIIWIENSNTGVVLASVHEKEVVQEIFDLLKISCM